MDSEFEIAEISLEKVESSRKIELVTCDAMAEVRQEIENADMYALMVVNRIREKGVTIRNDGDINVLQGRIGEMFVQVALEYAAENNPRIKLDPIQPGDETEHFYFRKDNFGRLYAFDQTSRRDVGEYDHIFTYENDGEVMPVVIETKIRNLKSQRSRDNWYHMMKPARVAEYLAPIAEHFGTNKVGYMIVKTKDMRKIYSQVVQDFLRSGGEITTLPLELDGIVRYLLSAKYGKSR